MKYFDGLRIGPVYWVKSGPVHKRLRVKVKSIQWTRDRVFWCDQDISFSGYHISYIDASGNIRLRCFFSGEVHNLFVGRVK